MTRTRWLLLGLVVGVALGFATRCAPQVSASDQSISRVLATPSTPLTYGWVMADNGQSWGVQIGPKADADGTHVAVYGWQNCTPTCGWELFEEYDALVPGSLHTYAITWGDGWHLSFDGREVAALNPGSTDAHFESDTGERTAA